MYIDTLMYRHPGSRLAFHLLDFGKTLQESSKIFVEHGLHVAGVQFLNPGLTVICLIQWPLLWPLKMNACTKKSKYTFKRSSCSPKFLNYLTHLKLPFMARKISMGFFWGFVGSPRDFLGFAFYPPFDYLCHFKFRVLPPPPPPDNWTLVKM